MAVQAARARRLPSLRRRAAARGGSRVRLRPRPARRLRALPALSDGVRVLRQRARVGRDRGQSRVRRLRQLPGALARRVVLDLAARACDSPLEHGLLRAPRRSAADDAGAVDGAPRQPGDPRAHLLPVGVLLPGARLLGRDLGDRALPSERRRARERRDQRRSSAGTSRIPGSATPTRRSSRSSSSTRGRRRGR